MTLRQVGGAIGIALLGSLVAGAYGDHVDTTGLPAEAAGAARDSLTGAHVVAERLDLPALARSADSAYVDGMSTVLVVCGIAALVAALLTAVLLPNQRPADTPVPDPPPAGDPEPAPAADGETPDLAPRQVHGRQ